MNDRKKTKWILLGVLFLLIACTIVFFGVGFALPGGGRQSKPAAATKTPSHAITKKISFGMVTDINKLGDKAYNDGAWAGCQMAGKELALEPIIIMPTSETNYVSCLTTMSTMAELTIGSGFMMQPAIQEAAEKNPGKRFGTIDCVVDLPNVSNNVFAENECGFLAGIAAAMNTKTKRVGFVGGMKMDVIRELEAGFTAGVHAVDPHISVIPAYTGNFSEVEDGRRVAIILYNAHADVIFHASGTCGTGVIQAADEKGFWAIGVDTDQADLSSHNRVLCSAVKRIDTACYGMIMSLANGTLKDGTVTWGLKDDAVALSDNGGNLNAETKAAVDKYTQAFKEGRFTIPATMEELSEFTPPTL
jgi:basic membrane protein A and related proteins